MLKYNYMSSYSCTFIKMSIVSWFSINFVIFIVCGISTLFCDFMYFELLYFMNSLLFHSYWNYGYICVCFVYLIFYYKVCNYFHSYLCGRGCLFPDECAHVTVLLLLRVIFSYLQLHCLKLAINFSCSM